MSQAVKQSGIHWNDIAVSSSVVPEISDNAKLVLEKRYLAKDEEGNCIETPEEMFKRINQAYHTIMQSLTP